MTHNSTGISKTAAASTCPTPTVGTGYKPDFMSPDIVGGSHDGAAPDEFWRGEGRSRVSLVKHEFEDKAGD